MILLLSQKQEIPSVGSLAIFFVTLLMTGLHAAELPLVRIAHGAFSEKIASCGSALNKVCFVNMA